MKKITKSLASFVMVLLLLVFAVPAADSMSVRTFCQSIDDACNLKIGDLSFSNVSIKIVNSKCNLTGSISNGSKESVNYTINISYYDKQFDGNLIASSNIVGDAKSGTSALNQTANLELEYNRSVDEIKAYILSIKIDNAAATSSSSTTVPSSNFVGDSSKGYVIRKYDVNMVVNENNTFDITETITAYFNQPKHGLNLEIPLKNTVERLDGTTSTNRAKISNLSLNDKYTTFRFGGNLKIKIGDEKTTVTGEQTYVLKYTYDIGADPVKTYDELYYNIIGDHWDTAIGDVTFKITMPKEFDASKLGFSSGMQGSTDSSKVKYDVTGNIITGSYNGILKPNEALTVRCELPEGYFVREPFEKDPLLICFMFVVPILGLLVAIFLLYKFVRGKTVETVEFYPPEGLNSLDVGFLYRGRAREEDVISLLVYLANKGYIKICDNGKKESIKIVKLKKYDGNDKNEKMFLDKLFANTNSDVFLNNLKYSFYDRMEPILSNINCKKNIDKVFGKISWKLPIIVCCIMIISMITTLVVPTIEYIDYEMFNTTVFAYIAMILLVLVLDILIICTVKKINFQTACGCIGMTVLFVFMFMFIFVGDLPVFIAMTFDIIYCVGVSIGVLCLIGMMIALRLISQQRTEYGNEMLGKIKGFRTFLKTAEKEKLESMVMQDPTYFYDILPYTYVLGVSNKWMKKFESISTPKPSWYDSPNAFDVIYFNHCIKSTQSTMLARKPSDSSSGGGFSGGGFSGGGSGGTSGSSW